MGDPARTKRSPSFASVSKPGTTNKANLVDSHLAGEINIKSALFAALMERRDIRHGAKSLIFA
jgi:hypothetical protein